MWLGKYFPIKPWHIIPQLQTTKLVCASPLVHSHLSDIPAAVQENSHMFSRLFFLPHVMRHIASINPSTTILFFLYPCIRLRCCAHRAQTPPQCQVRSTSCEHVGSPASIRWCLPTCCAPALSFPRPGCCLTSCSSSNCTRTRTMIQPKQG